LRKEPLRKRAKCWIVDIDALHAVLNDALDAAMSLTTCPLPLFSLALETLAQAPLHIAHEDLAPAASHAWRHLQNRVVHVAPHSRGHEGRPVSRSNRRQRQKTDAIEYEGSYWLVPEWLVSPDQKSRKPTRIIRVEEPYQLAGRLAGHPKDGFDIFVNVPVPTAVLEGRSLREEGRLFDVVEGPDIEIPVDETLQ
jgi:hypothetical protein